MSWLTEGTEGKTGWAKAGRIAKNSLATSLLIKGIAKIPHTTAKEKRDTMAATAAQIGYYTEQKNQLIAQKAETEQQKSVERARINEKGIRAKRNTLRSKTSNATPEVTNEIKSTLG